MNRDEFPMLNTSKVLTEKKDLPKPSTDKSQNLSQEAMLLTGKVDGSHLTLAGTIGSDQLLQDAARTGKRITLIDASSAPLTDKGMQSIVRLSPNTLILTRTSITDASIFLLKNNPRLKNLIIDETDNVIGTSFKIFPTIPNLEVLAVGGRSLTQKPFSSLANCKALTTVCLNSSPNLTDQVFLTLGTIPNLATVYIGKCPELTKAGLATLKKAKPYVRIVLSPRAVSIEQITELNGALGRNTEEGFLD